jgi:hypothetical protein
MMWTFSKTIGFLIRIRIRIETHTGGHPQKCTGRRWLTVSKARERISLRVPRKSCEK